MIKRFYVNHFRCLENFELPIGGCPSSLLIGKNGAGKSTVGAALELLQSVARGKNRVSELIKISDFTNGRTETPVRFEVELELNGDSFHYSLAFELPDGFKEARVLEEKLSHNGIDIFARNAAQVTLSREQDHQANFVVDWHLVALPVIQVRSADDPLHLFKAWLSRMLILAPIPGLITGDSDGETLTPQKDCLDFGEWFTGLLANSPSAYSCIDKFVRQVIPEFRDIKNPIIGRDSRSLDVQFQQANTNESLNLAFKELSDGEKCFFISAVVLASNEAYGPIFCFWDEPDNYLSLTEAGHFVAALRQSFQANGQLVVTSHNPEAIRKFSSENTFLLDRKSHFEPTQVRGIDNVEFNGNLIDAFIRDELEI